MTDLKTLKCRLLEDAEVRREYDARAEEYRSIGQSIAASKAATKWSRLGGRE